MTLIVAAAIKRDGVTHSMPPPARHHTILHLLPQAPHDESEQGFLTSEGYFVDREEAARLAVSAHQITRPKWGDRLYSEDLW